MSMDADTLKNDNKRKKLLIEPKFQKPFIFFTIFAAVFVSLIYFISLEIFYWRFRSQGLELGLSGDHIYFKFLDEQRFVLNSIYFMTTIVTCLAMIIFGLYYSNRIAGPLFRVKSYLKAFRDGTETAPLLFRENDYFSGVAHEINQTLANSNQSK